MADSVLASAAALHAALPTWRQAIGGLGCAVGLAVLYHRVQLRRNNGLRGLPQGGRLISACPKPDGPANLQHVHEEGGGGSQPGSRATLVFLHGFGCTSLEWARVLGGLRLQHRAITYDRVLFAQGLPRPRSCDVLVQELRALLRGAGVEGPVVLVGHSYGGLVAQYFAFLHPREVAGLVLIDPAHEDQFSGFLPRDFTFAFKVVPFVFALYRLLAPLGLVRFLDALSLFNFPPLYLFPPEERRRARELYSASRVWRDVALELEGCLASFPIMRSRRLTTPMPDLPVRLIIAAKRVYSPTLFPDAVTQGFLRLHRPLLDSASQRTFSTTLFKAENSDHWVHLQQPELVVSAIESLIDEVANSSS